MIRVSAPSRLHFGLFNLGSADPWPNADGAPAVAARRYGGVGLMIAEPGVQVAVAPADEWGATGPLAERALAFARRFAATTDIEPFHVTVEHAAPEHVGLGTGTQLGLAVAQALAVAAEPPLDCDAAELARRMGRGERSGIGVHGFRRGGFLIDAGKRGDGVAPLLVREEFPADWRVVLVLPAAPAGLHGPAERQAFDRLLGDADRRVADTLCRLALLGMLPALREHDFAAFGEALYDFNARVGDAFAPAQGGRYAGALPAAAVREARRLGLPGAGQSSWGPTVFAVADSPDRAAWAAEQLQTHFGSAAEVRMTAAFSPG